jgi:hypothetical protein
MYKLNRCRGNGGGALDELGGYMLILRMCVTDKCLQCRGVGYAYWHGGWGGGGPDINLILGGCHGPRIGRFWGGVCNIAYAGMCGCNQVFG